MKKVIQRKIDHNNYLPVPPAFLQVGSTIDFDCYIKRFNGYVIIIHCGTRIDEALYRRIQNHERIYIANAQREQYQRYRAAHTRRERPEPIVNDVETSETPPVDGLAALMKKARTPEAQISLLYRSGIALMHSCFTSGDETLAMSEVTAYAKILADFVAGGHYRLVDFLEKMPDTYSEPNHAVNVAILAAILARALNMTHRELEAIAVAGLLHDIGKRRIDSEILGKESELSDEEFDIVREHVRHSAQIVKNEKSLTPQILSAIRYHHERLDGSGYPNRLVGNQIPVMAQVVGLCDIFDALTTERTYRSRYSSFEGLRLIKREMNKQVNTLYVDHLIRLLGS